MKSVGAVVLKMLTLKILQSALNDPQTELKESDTKSTLHMYTLPSTMGLKFSSVLLYD